MKVSSQVEYTPKEIREKMQTVLRPNGSSVSFFSDQKGSIYSTVYSPFPGVSLVQKEVNRENFITNWRYGPVEALAIEYCSEGRLECFVDEECLQITPGDIVVFRTDSTIRELRYPGSHYSATLFMIYLDKPSAILDLYLEKANFTIRTLLEKYLPDNRYFNVLKNKEPLAKVFEDIHHSPKSVENMYFGVKILESLILMASEIPEIRVSPTDKVSKTSVDRAKEVYHYVMEHPEERYTIDELAKEFSISTTQLKKYFQMVYGVPIQTFVREQKMKAAAKILETSDMQITKVAQMFGYKNISKFAAAFEQTMGETPKQYSLRCSTYSDINS